MGTDEYSPNESQEQSALFEWAQLSVRMYPDLKLMFHIPNGGLRNKGVATRLKKEGVKPGVPDICLPSPRVDKCGVVYHGLYIELKTLTGRLSKKQRFWLDELQKQGYFAVVAHGFDKAKNYIEWYLKLAKADKQNIV